ncbi:MAG: hypothetical protein R3C59_30630 [Planctomycetaceae bacterium]
MKRHDSKTQAKRTARCLSAMFVLTTVTLSVVPISAAQKPSAAQGPAAVQKLSAAQGPAAVKPAIVVPSGFRVDHFADDDLAHDIHSMTVDAKGRVVVSGPGYVRILIDDDADGKADRYHTFADAPQSGAQGMYFMGPHLLCSGDDGLQIFRDDNGDDTADGPASTFLKIRAGAEHNVHAIQKGPDGWWYIIAGNMSGVTGTYATLTTSPLKNPQAGVLMRLKPDLSGGEILADGFRNAYDFAFSEAGDIFTFDSDGERDVSLPWYLPCRILQVTPRSHAGWVSRSWKRPNDFPDMPPVMAEFGRGSPTGMVCYRHDQFPSRYNGAVFALDWTFGRILVMALEENRGLWKGTSTVFAKAGGDFGFAPTDIAVSPDGSLFVSVGGRGTRGSVYRIAYDSGRQRAALPDAAASEDQQLAAVLKAPQPQSSWSRAQWYPMALKLGKAAFASAATDEGRRPVERMRAIEVLTDVFDGLDPATARLLTVARSVPVRARAAWSLGRSRPESPLRSDLLTFLNDREPLVVRAALEVLTTVRDAELLDRCLPRLAVCLGADEIAVRSAASMVVGSLSDIQQQQLSLLLDANLRSRVWLAFGQVARTDGFNAETVQIAVRMLSDRQASTDAKREALRLLQLSVGDVGPQPDLAPMLEGYTAKADLKPNELDLNPVRAILASALPSGDAAFDRELIRTIAMFGSLNRELIPRLLNGITATSTPADDIHRLAAVTRISAPRTLEETEATAQTLVNLDIKIKLQKLKQDSNWDDRIAELYDALCKVDSRIPEVIAERSGFGQPGHVLFLKTIPQEQIQTAIDGFARFASADDDYSWTNDVVFVIGRSGRPEHKTLIREQVQNLAVQDAVLMVMAREPDAADRPMYLSGLNSTQQKAVEACLDALTKLPRNNDPGEQYTLLSTARRLHNDDAEFELREKVLRLLENNMVQTFAFTYGKDGHKEQPEALSKVEDYLKTRYPDFRPKLDGGQTAAQVMAVLHEVQWQTGDPTRGAELFGKLSCTRCHGGRKALGPDLQGVAKRFSRDDLFAAIVDPNRDISDRYQLTTVQTKSGRTYSGLIVYESVDGIILRDSDHQTHRIEAEDMELKVRQRRSLMPDNLLKNVVDQDLADLDAYLRRL